MGACQELDAVGHTDPDVVYSVSQGIAASLQQGSSSTAVNEAMRSFEDWASEVALAPKKVIMIHGEHDPDLPINAARAFANCFPEQVKFVEIQGGGSCLNYTHTGEVLDLILEHGSA